MRNKRRVAAIVVVALAAIIMTGGLMASNMGFKLNYFLQAASGGVSNSGTQSIGLPYNQQVGLVSARDLFIDILNSGITAQNVQRYDRLTDQNAAYAFGTPDFNLNAGDGYLVKVGSSGDYIIVGSHNPALTVNLIAAAGGVSNSGTQRYSHPYHAVSATARDLYIELLPEVQNVQRYDILSDQNAAYTFGTPDFALVPGQSYLVKVGTDRDFVPAHY